MNDIEMRIAIGKACGCERIMEIGKGNWAHQPKFVRGWIPLPDYLSDLNAMHEAEKILTVKESGEGGVWDYENLLDKATNGEPWRATAKQRATAFLKTLNLWKEVGE